MGAGRSCNAVKLKWSVTNLPLSCAAIMSAVGDAVYIADGYSVLLPFRHPFSDWTLTSLIPSRLSPTTLEIAQLQLPI